MKKYLSQGYFASKTTYCFKKCLNILNVQLKKCNELFKIFNLCIFVIFVF